MARSNEVDLKFTGDARSAVGALRTVGAQSQTTGARLKSFAKRAALLGTVALGGALVLGAKKAINAEADLQEQVSKNRAVFKRAQLSVLQFSETSAKAFGISKREALEATGTFGNILVPMGLARGEAAKMSIKMVQLAADMASFNNASPEETLLALRSGLVGETEPLRKFGVSLNAARIKQEALNLGLSDGSKELTAAQKAQAAYSIILKDTADTQGDFTRTSSSMANQQRILRARVEDLSAKIGRALLPAVVKMLGAFLRFLDWAEANLLPLWNDITAAIAPAVRELGKILPSARQVAGWGGWKVIKAIIVGVFAAIATIVKIDVAIIRGLIDAGQAVVSWGGWGTIGRVIAAPFNAVKGTINGVIMLIGSIIRVVQGAINAISSLTGKASGVVGKVKGIVGSVTGFLGLGAKGAIVTQPTLSLIGEAGPEAVVPLNRMPGASALPGGGGGGGRVFSITVNALDPRSAADAVVEAIRQFERRNGPQFARA